MKDIGVLSWFLGTAFHCSEGMIEMSQKQYVGKLLTKFGRTECKHKVTPMVSGQERLLTLDPLSLQSNSL